MAKTEVRSGQILDGSITDTDVNTANKDGAAGTLSMRTLGTGAAQACAGNDARLSDARTPTAHSVSLLTDLRPISAFPLTFSTTTTNADPGAGTVRFNNASYPSVTQIYLDDLDFLGGGFDALNKFGVVGTLPMLKFFSRSAVTDYVLFNLVSVAVQTGYTQLNVSHVGGSGTALSTTAGNVGMEVIYNNHIKPIFRANKNGTDQTGITASTVTKVTFTTEAIDVGAFYDAANSKWVPPAGPVHVSLRIRLTGGVVVDNIYLIYIHKNGSEIAKVIGVAPANGNMGLQLELYDVANGTDYYEGFVYGEGAGDKTVFGGSPDSTFQGASL